MNERRDNVSASDNIGGADEPERIWFVVRDKGYSRQTLSFPAPNIYRICVPAYPKELQTLPVRGGPSESVVAYCAVKNTKYASVPVRVSAIVVIVGEYHDIAAFLGINGILRSTDIVRGVVDA